jgi:P27 family predicted phage terminase small subunit
VPTRPEWLLVEAKREWSRIVPELQSLGLLTVVDRAALASYCQWWARWVEAEKALVVWGLTFMTPNGYIQQRPEVAIAEKASDKCRAFLIEFGLTPASRSRVKLPSEAPSADPFEQYLKSERAEVADGQ